MLAAATSFFSRTAISQSYNIGPLNGSRSSTSGPSGSSSPVPSPTLPSVKIGLWRVQTASHKVTNKKVSVWTFDKRAEMEGLGPLSKDRVLQVLKAEAAALSKLRHPSILEMVEPLEETRNEIIYATEPILSSLDLSIPRGSRHAPLVELDEIEIQKGILQLCKGLSFLHSSARLIHTNLKPECVIINDVGDWKISGLGLTIPLVTDGSPTRWEFPGFDGRVPSYVQRSFDFIAPEYVLDEVLITASDMYSLGCLIYAVHCKGSPPFRNHGGVGGLRDNASRSVPDIGQLDTDLQDLLRSLITRGSHSRPTPSTLPSHPFFSSLPISTLNFLDRSNFTMKTREEKISFMRGLTAVLDRFSEGLRTRKILPSLLEEMKDTHLLPYILPNVFSISNILSATQFASVVLPSLKPLFTIKDPPQNMLTLLDNLLMLQSKTERSVFREQVLPLAYHALESEHAVVQERALLVVPNLCETIDYAEVSNVLFPRVALVFAKTKILTVKLATLVTFLSMVKTLDETNLTQKLVPLLSKIKTKEPAVMMATLSVQEAMGVKVDREAVATLVLPQLWAMSMGPLLNIEQYQRFMSVIRRLGERVEKEHNQFLRDSQRTEDRSATNNCVKLPAFNTGVDFESLVGRANGATVKPDTVIDGDGSHKWDDDVWGSIFSSTLEPTPSKKLPPSPSVSTMPTSGLVSNQAHSLPSSPRISTIQSVSRPSRLGAKPIPSASFDTSTFTSSTPQASQPSRISSPPSQHQRPTSFMMPPPPLSPSQLPNYNVSLFDITATPPTAIAPVLKHAPPSHITLQPNSPKIPPLKTSPLSAANILIPSQPARQTTTTRLISKDDWGDFDPLK